MRLGAFLGFASIASKLGLSRTRMGNGLATVQFFIYGRQECTQKGWEKAKRSYGSPDPLDLCDLSGRVMLVTGANSGIGFEIAQFAASRGARTYMLCRNAERAEAARAKIVSAAATRNCSADVHVLLGDTGLRTDMERCAAEFCSREKSLDALVCNAGVMAVPDARTPDGFDVQAQVNHLSHFLLTKLLMPSLEAAAAARGEARVVQHSSGARKPNRRRPGSDDLVAEYFERRPPKALGGDGVGACFGRYHQTKLANTAFAIALHSKLAAAGSRVKSVCAEPGVASTALQRNTSSASPRFNRCLFAAVGFAMTSCSGGHVQSAADGACPLIVAAFDARTGSGDLWMPSKHIPGKKVSVHGTPARSIEGGKPTATHQWIVEKFDSEALTLSLENQATVWAASESAVGETWAVP